MAAAIISGHIREDIISGGECEKSRIRTRSNVPSGCKSDNKPARHQSCVHTKVLIQKGSKAKGSDQEAGARQQCGGSTCFPATGATGRARYYFVQGGKGYLRLQETNELIFFGAH